MTELYKLTVKKYIENLIMPSDPLYPMWNRENFIFRKQIKWNYIDACLIKSLLMLENPETQKYAVKFMNAYTDSDGNIPTFRKSDFNLDNVNGGKNLIFLYGKTNEERYRKGFEYIYKCLSEQPRLKCGNFWHKAIYPNQIWLDGVYMSLPFMAEYAVIKQDENIILDIQRQLENICLLMRDDKTGLYYHGYDETKSIFWADRKTGCSKNFWLRSMGWLCAGLADISEIIPEMKISREMLSDLLISLSEHITSENMLLQLPVLHELKGNYPETSGSLLFAYSAIKSHEIGISDKKIMEKGSDVFRTVTEKYIINEENIPIMKNICLMGGLGGNPPRDGSAEYYLSEKVVINDAKGIAPYIMTYAEMKKYEKLRKIKEKQEKL